MSQYTDLVADIVGWTNRPLLVAETDMAIRQAVNKAHRAGHFPRDLVTAASVPAVIEQVQSIDYTAAPFVRFRNLATIGPAGYDLQYTKKTALDLFDADGFARVNIAYVVGNMIHVRAAAPVDALKVVYWQRPDLSNLATMADWIADVHRDLIVLWAAGTVLAAAGEQEIKSRVEKLAGFAYADLIAESMEAGE